MRNSTNFSTAEKIHHLKILDEALQRKLNKITFLQTRNADNFKLCKLAVVVQKTKGKNIFEDIYTYVETKHNVSFKRAGKDGPQHNATGHKLFNQLRDTMFDHRSTEAGDGLLPKVDEAGDEEMEVASDEERNIFDPNDLDNELKLNH